MLTWRPRVLAVTSPAALALFLAADVVLRANLSHNDLFFEVAFTAFAVASAVSGAVIVARQPRNVIGWLLLVIPLWAAFAFMAGNYATYALVTAPGAVPFGRAAAWIDRWAIVPTLCLPILLFLLFPDGRVPSVRWRPVLWLACGAPPLTAALFALTPGRMTGAFAELTSIRVINPTGIRGAGGVIEVLSVIGGFSCLLAVVLAGASLVARFRSRRGDERQQIKWLAFVGATFLAELALTVGVGIPLGDSAALQGFGNWMFSLMFLTLALGIPAACVVALLKYRLYDIDVVISKTVVYAMLAAFITAVYTLVVVGAGAIAGSGGRPSLGLSILATAVVAVAFQPVRERAQRFANRLVYGRRATPYEALSQLSERVASTYASEDLLPTMARIVAEATGAARTDVWLRSGGEFRDGAWWPADAEPRPVILLPDGSLPAESGGPERIVPVIYDGELLGGLSITKKRGDAVTPAEDKLVGNLAAQAGLVLRNVGLTGQLMARLAELRASRERLVTTQDRERRRLERDIRDGAQRQLAGLASKLGLAAQALGHDEDQAKALLDEVISHTAEALKDLRELARGIYPALLADMGVAAALDAQARKAPIRVSVEAAGIGRYPQETEAAVYFCTLEALGNAAKHADPSRAIVRLSESNAELAFEVADDGRGFDTSTTHQGTGLQGMADRIDALGGHLQIDSGPGQGTRISGRLPASAIS